MAQRLRDSHCCRGSGSGFSLVSQRLFQSPAAERSRGIRPGTTRSFEVGATVDLPSRRKRGGPHDDVTTGPDKRALQSSDLHPVWTGAAASPAIRPGSACAASLPRGRASRSPARSSHRPVRMEILW